MKAWLSLSAQSFQCHLNHLVYQTLNFGSTALQTNPPKIKEKHQQDNRMWVSINKHFHIIATALQKPNLIVLRREDKRILLQRLENNETRILAVQKHARSCSGSFLLRKNRRGVTRRRHCMRIGNLSLDRVLGGEETQISRGELHDSENIRLPKKSPTRFVTTCKVQTLWHLVGFLKLQHHCDGVWKSITCSFDQICDCH